MSVSRCSPTSRLPCSGSQPADRDQIQFVFVTTDPARDKEKQIRRYLDRFNPAFVGLTGPLSTIKTRREPGRGGYSGHEAASQRRL